MAKPDDGKKLSKEERIDSVARLMAEAAPAGKEVTTKQVMELLGVSKPTAIEVKRAAAAKLAAGVPVAPVLSVAPDVRSSSNEDALAVGIDMTQQLAESAGRLKAIAEDLEADLRHARYFVLGCPPGESYPGLCRRCGDKEVAGLTVRNQPTLLQIGYVDIAKLAAEAVKTQKALTEIVATYNGVLSQYYSYQALERFIADVRTAIANVCPEYQKALAAEIRRLQTISGGAHG